MTKTFVLNGPCWLMATICLKEMQTTGTCCQQKQLPKTSNVTSVGDACSIWAMTRLCRLVKATFDNMADLNDIIGSLEKLYIPQAEEAWRNTFISSPKMFKVCEKGFIYISKKEILLLCKWYLNHYHSELFTYHLWVEKFEDEDVSFEGFCKEYAWQKRSDISPHISIKDFLYRNNKYSIEIYTVLNGNNDFDRFQLTFGFNNENKSDYPDEIIEILKELGIEDKDKKVNRFSWYCKSENSVLRKTKSLTEVLFQLKQK